MSQFFYDLAADYQLTGRLFPIAHAAPRTDIAAFDGI